MKTIGLLGGMSWESTLEYYREINRLVGERLGGLHSARIVMHSVDFGPIEEMMRAGEWPRLATLLGDAACGLERAGADLLLICTNTMHKLVPEIEGRLNIPLLHIGDAVGRRLAAAEVRKAGLLGTSFTMEEDFYRRRLREGFGIEVMIPEESDRRLVNEVIFSELCRGTITPASRREYVRIIDELAGRGAEGVVLGCTEIGLLVRPADTRLPLFDSAAIHAEMAVEEAIEENDTASAS